MKNSLLLLLLAGCTADPNADDFITEEPSNSSTGHPSGGSDLGAAASADAGGKAATPTDDRTVEEADLYRLQGNLLYYLNTYRGLLIYDVGDPQNPKQVARLPIHGVPIEMFFEGTRVYALVRDALDVHMQAGQLAFERRQRSQLVTIDVTSPSQPKILERFDIEGQLREGVSRKIGNVIYVVSYVPSGWGNHPSQPDTAWVYSYDVSGAVRQVGSLQLFQGGSVHQNDTNGYVDKSFTGVTIAATPTSLMVAENWYNSAWSNAPSSGCGSYDYFQSSIISLVDVSDPAGKIAVRTRFEERGLLADQFKQTVVDDQTYLGIFQRQEWSGAGCSGQQVVVNRLISVDVSTAKEIGSLAFGNSGEAVHGSVFDPARKVVFAITSRQTDPLYVLDYSDPTHLAIKSQIDGLSGDMSVFSFAAPGFLLGVGRDTSGTCSGFDMTRASTQMAVSLIDVQKLDAIRLVQRRCVSLDSATWQWSQISWNQDQAHKMLGLYSDAQVSLIGVPVTYWQTDSSDQWAWGELRSAVGLMRYDLSAYDPAKDNLHQNVFEDLGTLLHPHGEVERTIFYRQNGKLMVGTLSQTHLALTDLSDLHAPVRKSEIEVAPFVRGLYRFGAYLVKVLGDVYYGWGSPTRTELRVVAAEDSRPVDERPTVASLSLSGVQQLLQQGSRLLALAAPDLTQDPRLAVVDLSDPAHLRLAGQASIPNEWYLNLPTSTWVGKESAPYRGNGSYGYFSQTQTTISTDAGLISLVPEYSNDYTAPPSWHLHTVDLSDPSHPRIAESQLDGSEYLSVVAAPDDSQLFYLAGRDKVGTANGLDQFKYFAREYRLQNGGWTAGARISLPGILEQTFLHGGERRFLTHDDVYTQDPATSYWSGTPRLHLLAQRWGGATRLASHSFDQFWLNGYLRDGERIYVTGSDTTNGWGSDGGQLVIYDLSAARFDESFRASTGSYWNDLLGVNDGRLYLSPSWDGMLVLDVRDPTKPVGIDWVTTEWGVTDIAFAQDAALVADGYFGVVAVDLAHSALTQ